VAKRPKATGQPKRRRADRYSKPFRSKPKPEGYVFGRPTLYRPEYCQRAIEFMGQGYSVTALAGELQIAKETIYLWIREHADFMHAINRGRAARVAALETKLLTTSQGVGVTAAIFALKNADPDEWQDRYNTETRVNVSIEHVSDAELLAIISKGQNAPALIEAKPVEAKLEPAEVATDVTDTCRPGFALSASRT
jgi:transposase-like protein